MLSYIFGLNKIMFFLSWKSYLHALLLHPSQAKILIRSRGHNHYLPFIEINKGIWLDNFKAIKNVMETELNLSVNILHYASYRVHQKQRKIKAIYILEPQDSLEKVEIGTWYDRNSLENLSFINPEEKSIIKKYLLELENKNIPKFRPPWAQPGWLNEVSYWIKNQLKQLGYEQLSPPEYVKSWSISCILQVKTTAGNIYFKEASTLPLFCHEPKVTAELANLFPEHIPTVITIDTQRHWMLLADFGKSINNRSLKSRQKIYSLFAQIQIKSAKLRESLLAAGCLDRGLDVLQSQIEPLVNDKNSLSELSKIEIDRLHSLVPILKNLCSQLADYKIPATLVHGDLHLGNVAFYKNNYLFFDWTDSCISHPFFDFFELFFARRRQSLLSRFKSLWQWKFRESLRDLYLSQWIQYEPPERLLEAWNIAKPLCALHHAITYQHIIASLEPRAKQEFESALAIFLREIIRAV